MCLVCLCMCGTCTWCMFIQGVGVWCVFVCVIWLSVYKYCVCVYGVVFDYLRMWGYMGEYLHGVYIWCTCVVCVV